MKRKTHIKQLAVVVPLIFGMLLAPIMNISVFADDIDYAYSINLTNLTYQTADDDTDVTITTYSASDADYRTFLAAYEAGTLPLFYETEFLFDGAGKYIPYDLDDLKDGSKTLDDFSPLEIKVLNINTTGDILLTGEYTGMLALNTNEATDDINLLLNDVKIDTNDKKAPAIYVYNQNITYTGCKVTLSTVAGSTNTIEGGKFKKVSLMEKDDLAAYASYYGSDYETYAGYYGIYTADQIEDVLFAKVQASQEDLQDGDPYYFYKGAGAISSDIDLYFEGEGYLAVTSKNKEGIETKGNLTFAGGIGDYYIFARDDALNTTTRSSAVSGAHNTLTIDVHSLAAIVDPDTTAASEGDAIDSNGGIIINGGIIYAFAHPTSPDDGLDSETGTIINGGTILALGNMSDPVSTNSSQNFLKVAFQNKIAANTPVVITDTNGDYIAGFTADRTFSVLTYSSDNLDKNATYSIYTGGTLNGDTATVDSTTIYTEITSYTGGTLAGTAASNTNPGNTPPGGDDRPNPPTPPSDDDRPTPTPPSDDTDPTPPSDDTPSDDTPSGGSDDTTPDEIIIVDDEDVAIPSTSDTTVVYVPNTGRKVKISEGTKSAPVFAWAISGCSAVALVLYVLISRRRHAVRFER